MPPKKLIYTAIAFGCIVLQIFSNKSQASDPAPKESFLKLDNKISYQHIQSDIDSTRVVIFVKAGHLYNGNTQGIAHLTEHLFNLGGNAKNVSRIDDFLASANGTRRATTNSTGARYWYEFPSEYFDDFLVLIRDSFANIVVSEDAKTAQIAAINREWQQGQNYQELIDWEQTFRVFAQTNQTDRNESFFMGNSATFLKLEPAELQEEIYRMYSRYIAENIIILTENPNSYETAYKQVNQTVGNINLNSRKSALKTEQELKVNFSPVTEVRKREEGDGEDIQFNFAFPAQKDASNIYSQFLIYLVRKSSATTTNISSDKIQILPTSIEYMPNEYHMSDGLYVAFPSQNINAKTIFQQAQYLLAVFRTTLSSFVAVDRMPELSDAYQQYISINKFVCSNKNLSFESARDLDNQIHFERFSSWLNSCDMPEELNYKSFAKFIERIISANVYTRILVNSEEWKELPSKKTMNHYEQSFVLLAPTTPVNSQVSLSLEFPKENSLLSIADQLISANKDVKVASIEDGQFATQRILKPRITDIDDYAEALILSAYLEFRYNDLIDDALALNTGLAVKVDDTLSVVAQGNKAVSTFLANTIALPSSIPNNPLTNAKSKAITSIKAKMNDNQVFRMNEFLARVQSGHIWTDEELISAVQRYGKDSPEFSSIKLNKRSEKNLELDNNAPVNILASLRQIKDGTLEEKVYAVLLNSMMRSEYKDKFRNELKIAYTAVTGHKFNDKGTGFVTLLQTSTHSIEDMLAMNQKFFSEMFAKVNALTEEEFLRSHSISKMEILRLSGNSDFVFNDSLISQTNDAQIELLIPSLSKFQNFSKKLLFDNSKEQYIAIKGIKNPTSGRASIAK